MNWTKSLEEVKHHHLQLSTNLQNSKPMIIVPLMKWLLITTTIPLCKMNIKALQSRSGIDLYLAVNEINVIFVSKYLNFKEDWLTTGIHTYAFITNYMSYACFAIPSFCLQYEGLDTNWCVDKKSCRTHYVSKYILIGWCIKFATGLNTKIDIVQ